MSAAVVGSVVTTLLVVAAVAAYCWWRKRTGGTACALLPCSRLFARLPGGAEDGNKGDASSYASFNTFSPFGGGGGHKRGSAGTGAGTYLQFADAAHGFSISYPRSWIVTRAEHAMSLHRVRIACDSREETYKCLAVSWDEVSWSTLTPEDMAQRIRAQVVRSASGEAGIISQGLYEPSRRKDGAYYVVYTFSEPTAAGQPSSMLQVLLLIVLSLHRGRRRMYSISYTTDADAFPEQQRLAKTLINSFRVDDEGASLGAGATTGASSLDLATGGHTPTLSPSEEVHVNVWDRERAKAAAAAAVAAATEGVHTADVADRLTPWSPTYETSFNVPDVTWRAVNMSQAGLRFAHPALWRASAPGYDDSLGFGTFTLASVQRWTLAYTCDHRESSYKHMNIVCVDITPCFDIVAAHQARDANVLQGMDTGTLLLTFLLYRYRSELAEEEALAGGRPPTQPPLLPGEEALRPWTELFLQRWPRTCRVSTPVCAANESSVTSPVQLSISDVRSLGCSRLLKVGGTVHTVTEADAAAARAAYSGRHGSSDGSSDAHSRRRHSSSTSLASLEFEGSPVPGEQYTTTSAVLVGLHEAMLRVSTGLRSAAKPTPLQKRVIAHVVTFATDARVFTQYEPLARAVLQRLDAATDAAALSPPPPRPPTAASSAGGAIRTPLPGLAKTGAR